MDGFCGWDGWMDAHLYLMQFFSCKQIILIILLPVLLVILLQQFYFNDTKRHADLVIGILSSRYNFVQRETIRRTWLNRSTWSSVNEFKTKSLFVVGSDDCEIPAEDRISAFACERLILNASLISLPADLHLFRSADSIIQTSDPNCLPFVGLSFRVMADVILTKVGCLVIQGKTCQEVELTDIYDHRSIFRESMVNASHEAGADFVFKVLHPSVLLPTGFTGLIISRYEDKIQCSNQSFDQEQSGLILLLKSYRGSGYFPAESFDRNHQVLVSFQFRAAGSEQRFHNTRTRNTLMRAKLEQEIQSHDDVLLVSVPETYRNLPTKLLHFIHWAQSTHSFKFLMKSDDDCIVNIDGLQKYLIQKPLSANSWWGNFRKRWPVDDYGKWAEKEYVSVTYPPFACGSGYVLGSALVQLLFKNWQQLHPFQGEDVSMGIWLSPFHPVLEQDSRCLCSQAHFDAGHQKDFISVPNLTPDRLEHIWRQQQQQQQQQEQKQQRSPQYHEETNEKA